MENLTIRDRQVNEFIETVDDIGWRWNRNAIEKIADKSYEAKTLIRNVLMKHENWDEEKQGVIFSADYTRKINGAESNNLCEWIRRMLAEKYPRDSEGLYPDEFFIAKDAAIYLTQPSQFITDEYDIARINQLCERVEALAKFHVHANQKRSRAVGKFCKMLGLDKHPEYNDRFARYGDSINPLKVKRWTKISVDVVDFLRMSDGTSWSSCHNPDKSEFQGCHCSGGISHALDAISVIMYTVTAEYNGDKLEMQPKTDRCIFYVDVENFKHFIQSKVYPDNSEDKSRDYREIFQSVWAKCLDVPNYWVVRNNVCYENERSGERIIDNNDGSTVYPDWDDTRSKRITHCRLKGIEVNDCEPLYVGANPICIECGWEHDIPEQINCCHEYCGKTCETCGERIDDEDNEYYSEFHDRYGCPNCMEWNSWVGDYFYDSDDKEYVENLGEYIPVCYMEDNADFIRCEGCGEWVYIGRNGDYYTDNDGYIYCESCFNENFTECAGCGDLIRIDDSVEINGEYYCDDCVTTCDECGQVIPSRDAIETDDGRTICEECAETAENGSDNVA